MKKLILILCLSISVNYLHRAFFVNYLYAEKDFKISTIDILKRNEIHLGKIQTIAVSCLFKDTLYLINGTQIIKFCVIHKKSFTDNALNSFLNIKSKSGNFATNLFVDSSGYHISFPNEIFHLSFNGVELFSYSCKKEIYGFSVTEKGNYLISSVGNVVLINKKGEIISSEIEKELSTPNYFYYENGLGFLTSRKMLLFLEANNVIKKEYFDINIIEFQQESFYPSYVTDSVLVGFSYYHRNRIYRLPLKDSATTEKIFYLENDYSPSSKELQNEEGIPNFKIIGNNSFCYVFVLYKGMLSVFKVEF